MCERKLGNRACKLLCVKESWEIEPENLLRAKKSKLGSRAWEQGLDLHTKLANHTSV